MSNVTGASDLLEIGERISGREYDRSLGIYKTRGNIKALEELDRKIDEALLLLNSGISALGHVLAYCEHEEVLRSMADIGFLISGLGSLADRLTQEKAQVSDELRWREKAKSRSPENL